MSLKCNIEFNFAMTCTAQQFEHFSHDRLNRKLTFGLFRCLWVLRLVYSTVIHHTKHIAVCTNPVYSFIFNVVWVRFSTAWLYYLVACSVVSFIAVWDPYPDSDPAKDFLGLWPTSWESLFYKTTTLCGLTYYCRFAF